MKKFAFILLLSIVNGIGLAQTWAPIGAKWTYGVEYAFLPVIDFREWISIGDTMVQGHNCKIIQRFGQAVSYDLDDKLITYEENGKILWLVNDQFTTLYDFNKNAGESWTTTKDSCEITITVDSTGTDTINGFPLKTQYVSSSEQAFEGKIIEHIGHTSQPNPFFLYFCEGIFDDMDYYTGLRCYEDSLIGYHSFNIAPTCDYYATWSAIHENEYSSFMTLYPNPFSTQTEIKTTPNFDNASLTLENNIGQILKQWNNVNGQSIILDRGQLKSGIYFIRLIQNNQTVTIQTLMVID